MKENQDKIQKAIDLLKAINSLSTVSAFYDEDSSTIELLTMAGTKYLTHLEKSNLCKELNASLDQIKDKWNRFLLNQVIDLIKDYQASFKLIHDLPDRNSPSNNPLQ